MDSIVFMMIRVRFYRICAEDRQENTAETQKEFDQKLPFHLYWLQPLVAMQFGRWSLFQLTDGPHFGMRFIIVNIGSLVQLGVAVCS